MTALTLSGLSTRRFAFEAFLPADKKERAEIFEELKTETRTMIIYEAPHRLLKTLKELENTIGNRKLTICKELTKRHETAFQTTIEEAIIYYEANEPRGEFVMVIEGRSMEELKQEAIEQWMELSIEEHMDLYLSQGIDKKEAMKKVAKERGVSKRDIYQALL